MIAYLVRHGAHDLLGRVLAGRMDGVSLNDDGLQQAAGVAAQLASVRLDAIYSSPMQRCLETAAPLASVTGLEVQVCEDLHELDCGHWTGRRFDELSSDESWSRFNTVRSLTRVPGGETVLEVQSRMVRCFEGLASEYPEGRVAVFGHADPIKTALCFYLGMHLDAMFRLEVTPGSVATLEITPYCARVHL